MESQVPLSLVELNRYKHKLWDMADVPDGSNYLMEQCECGSRKIVERFNTFHRSNTPISGHLNILNPSELDKIVVSESLRDKIHKYINS